MKKIVWYLILLCPLVIVTGCGKELQIVEKLDFEINSELKMVDLVVPDDEISIVNGDDLIDTSVLGEKEIVIKYYVNDKDNYMSTKIKIIDTTPPVIENAKDKITAVIGSKVNPLDGIKVSDNSKEKITAIVEGEYNVNKAGEYKLKYVATDSSGNVTEKEFSLVVNNLSVKTSGYYVYKGKEYWAGIRFKSNNKVTIDYNYCPEATKAGFGCGGYSQEGTYKVSSGKATITLSVAYDENGADKSVKGSKITCTIKSTSKVVCSNKTFNWSSKFI